MIQRQLLPIKMKRIDEQITPRSELILFDEFIKAFGLKELIVRYMPHLGSNKGFDVWRYIEPLVLMLYERCRHGEDLRELRKDRVLMGDTVVCRGLAFEDGRGGGFSFVRSGS